MDRLTLDGPARVGTPERFTILMGLGGSAEVRHRADSFPIGFGETMLLPAALGACEVVPRRRGDRPDLRRPLRIETIFRRPENARSGRRPTMPKR